MDLDDLDDLGAPKQVPSRVSKFAPRSSKPKPKPKQEPSSKLEPPSSSVSNSEPPESFQIAKPDTENASKPVKKEDDIEIKPNIHDTPKADPAGSTGAVEMEICGASAEPSASTGAVKMEIGGASAEPMDVVKEEEELKVVREFDVFFNPSFDADTQLFVMQYPLRPRWRPYELDEQCNEVRLKPETNEVEIDLSIDDSTNWDAEYGNRLKMTKQTLSTFWRTPRAAGHCVGVLIGDKIHLNPVHAVVQLRPSFDHLTSGGSKRKNSVTSDAEVEIKVENSTEGKPVGPSKKQNKKMEPGNEHTEDFEESWVPLKYHGSKSDLSSKYLQKMVAVESSCIQFAMSPYDYMSSLCPGPSSDNNKPKGLSRRALLSLPLEERVKKLLSEGPKVHRFSALMHYAADDPIEDVLTLLQRYGHLVQGHWVPKTSLLFPDSNEGSKEHAGRDYVLLLFTKSVVISSSELNVPFKKDMMRFLAEYAVERPAFKEWKFKEETDTSFQKLYPDIVKKQEQFWEGTEKKFAHLFSLASKSRPGMRSQTKKPSMAQNPEKPLNLDRSATKSASGVLSRRTMTGETREALRKALPKVLSSHKVCSFQLICQSLREMAVSLKNLPKADSRLETTAAFGADAPPEELREVINEVATEIHGLYVLKSSPDHPEYDPLRKVVINLLLARGPNAKIKKTEVVELARRDLKREITNNEYNKVMTDLCESKGSAWVLKSGDGKP